METEKIKQVVKDKYGSIARQSQKGCGCGCSTEPSWTIVADNYQTIDGYVAEADLGLGCGLPTEFAEMKPGETVLDLGSGAGNDAFIARRYVGAEGKVIGVDMTAEMIEKARLTSLKLKYDNVEFRYGEIESLPVESGSVDLVISNCVLNLLPDKEKAFAEIYRVLKPGGRFVVSDIVLGRGLPDKIKAEAELYAGCVSGALLKSEYLEIIGKCGFDPVVIPTEKVIDIPASYLLGILETDEIDEFKADTPLISITVKAFKAMDKS